MNAMGHVTVALAAGTDALWDLMAEMCVERERAQGMNRGGQPPSPGVHGFTPEERVALGGDCRYCVHPTGMPDVEFRSDDLQEAVLRAAVWLAKQLPEEHVWRRS